MSAWQYCRVCDSGLREPLVSELYRKEMICPSCGCVNEPVGDLGDAILGMEQKLTETRALVDWLVSLAREVGREPPDL